ncbi:Ig-like domain-containing protein, partial [Harryflintia acetispora]
ETEAITVKLGNNNPDLITGFTVAAAPAGGGEALYGVRQGAGWDYRIPFSAPPQEDTDFTITVTSQSSAPGFHEAGVKETVMTYNAIKSLTIRSGDTDATGKTLYLQTNNAQGRQSVQLTVSKNGSTSSTGPTGHPYMKANGYAEQVLWTSSNEAVASVDSTGLITAHTGGTATVTASVYGGKVKAACTVNVSAVTGVSLSHTAYTLFTGGTAAETQFTLSAALTGGVSSDELEWTNSDPGAAAMTVSADGHSATIAASGKTAGSTTITAHIKGAPDTAQYKASCTVTVVTIGSVSVSPNSYTIYTLGEPRTVQLAATVTPNAAPVWSSSNPSAATVNQTGLVSAVAPGSTTVTATVGGKSGSSTITVKDKIPVASVTVSGTNSLVRTSDKTTVTTQLAATVKPDNAHFKAVSWAKTGGSASININASGLVTATAAGSATFTATVDGMTSAPYSVTVTDQGPTGIVIGKTAATFKVGENTTVNAAVSPWNALNTNINWWSDNPAVAAVSAGSTANNGTITVYGVGAGTANIYAQAQGNTGFYQTMSVTVQKPVIIDDSGNAMDEGKTVTWGGKSWWVVDDDGSPYGGNSGSVVLLANFDYYTGKYGSLNNYSTSLVRTQCANFYNGLTAAQKEKLSAHKYVGDYAWLPSAYEIYGSSRPSNSTDAYTETKQFSYFINNGVTASNYSAVKTVFGSTGYRWIRSPRSYVICVVGPNGELTSSSLTASLPMRFCIILNP